MSANTTVRNLLTALTLLVAFASSSTFAQTVTATLSGTVNDERNAAVSGAIVRVTNTDAGFERTVTTNTSGTFVVPLLPPATYRVTVERTGFAPFEVNEVTLNTNDQKSLNIILRVGQVGASVDVNSQPPLIDESPAVGTTIDRNFVQNLPLNGRSLQTLIALSPGVVAVPVASNGGSQGQFSVNGQRANSNYFTVDGVSGNFSVTNFEGMGQNASGSLPSTNIAGGFSNLASVDALQEFAIQTSTVAPEFGRSPGGQISLVTRSGENAFHGSLFEYFRNDALDAKDFFDTVKPPLRFNNFGGAFGGPIIFPRFGDSGNPFWWKGTDKAFFFVSYEGQRFVLPQPAVSTTVPSLASRNNAPNAIARAILDGFPIPNGADIRDGSGNLTGGAIYETTFSNPTESDALSIRIDYNLNKNITVFGRFNDSPSNSVSRDRGNPSSKQAFTQNTRTFTLGSTQVFGPSMVNEIRYNWSKQEGFAEFLYDGYGGGVLPPESIILPASVSDLQRRYTLNPITNISSGGITFGDVAKNESTQGQIIDNLSFRLGAHQLKFGADYRWLRPVTAANDLVAATVSMTLASVYNNVSPLALAARQVRFVSDFRTYSFYAQDTWKTNKRLTITYGARWEINPAPTGREGKAPLTFATPPDLSQLNQNSLVLAPMGTPYFETDFTNIAPRFGAAFQISQKQGRELVLRGGIGLFYDLGQTGFGNVGGFPYSLTRIQGSIPLPFPTSFVTFPPVNFTPSPTNRGSITVAAVDYSLPRVYQWNLTAEQSLGRDQSLSLAYVAAIGRKLVRTRTVQFATTSAVANTYFSSNFSGTTFIDNASESSYHSMQAQFTRRLSQGLQGLVNYTWSHSIDNGSNDNGITSPGYVFPQDVYFGDSDFDVRHIFSGAVTYDLPFRSSNKFANALVSGWSLNSIISARTGLPFNVTISETTAVNTSVSFRRPNVTGMPFFIEDPSFASGRRLNSAAFNFNVPVGQMGSLGRNALRGNGFWQVDFGLHRSFAIGEKAKLQFRAEAFNIFNHPNFLYPTNRSATRNAAGVVTVPSTFGLTTQTAGRAFGGGGNTGGFNPLFQNGGPRSIQLALRLNF